MHGESIGFPGGSATMATTQQFNRDSWAKWYAQEHRKTDPGVDAIYYLPKNAGEREIRFIEINSMMGERTDDAPLEPVEYGVDTGTDTAHKLFVLDVTPEQWNRIQSRKLELPADWSIEDAVPFK
jgi:hypothetical protein